MNVKRRIEKENQRVKRMEELERELGVRDPELEQINGEIEARVATFEARVTALPGSGFSHYEMLMKLCSDSTAPAVN